MVVTSTLQLPVKSLQLVQQGGEHELLSIALVQSLGKHLKISSHKLLLHRWIQHQGHLHFITNCCRSSNSAPTPARPARLHGSTPILQACSSCLGTVTCKHHLKLTYFLLHEASSTDFTCPNNQTGKENKTWLPQRSKPRQTVQIFKFGSFC